MLLKTNVDDMNIDQAFAFIYRPAEGSVATMTAATIVDGSADATIWASSALASVSSTAFAAGTAATASYVSGGDTTVAPVTGQTVGTAGEVGIRDNDHANGAKDTLVVALPSLAAADVDQGDMLVIQNVVVDGVYYTITVDAPAAVLSTTDSSNTEPDISSLIKIYKQVYLPINTGASGDLVGDVGTGDSYGGAAGPYLFSTDSAASEPIFTFREDISATGLTATWGIGVDDDTGVNNTTTDQVVDFTETAAKVTGAGNERQVSVTLDALASASVTEATTKYVGRNATLTVAAQDYAGNPSSFTITFMKGHGLVGFNVDGSGATDNDETIILNMISGDAIK